MVSFKGRSESQGRNLGADRTRVLQPNAEIEAGQLYWFAKAVLLASLAFLGLLSTLLWRYTHLSRFRSLHQHVTPM